MRERGRRRFAFKDLFAPPDAPGAPQVRRLARFARPYLGQLVASFGMSGLAAIAKVGYVFILKRLLEPILEAGVVRPPLEHVARLARPLPEIPLLPDAVGAPVMLVLESVATGWNAIAPRRQLMVAAAALLALVLVEQFNKYAQKLVMRRASMCIVRDVREALYTRVLSLSMRFFQANHSGRVLSRLTNDLAGIGNLLVNVSVDVSTDFLALIATLVYVFWSGGWIVAAFLAIAIVSFVPVQQISRRLRRKEVANQSRMASLFIALTEVLQAQKIVKAFTAEEAELRRFRDVNEEYTEGTMKTAELSARVQPIVEVAGNVGIAGFIVVAGVQVLQGTWSKADFIAILVLLAQAVAYMRRLADTNTKFQAGLSSADRIATLLAAEPELVDAPDAVAIDGLRESIRFEDVDYDHDPEHPVLRGVSFELRRGQTLALVGETGSGKSTLADLVPRFYDVDAGRVLVDGRDVRAITMESLRRQIAVVTQETVLFRDTIGNNIRYGRPGASQAEIEAAAKAAHAHDFIMRLPRGYETEVGERGTRLSGGERQRVAIARALLKDAPILILDEATSALDSASEALVQDAIDTLKQGRTTLAIAHRLSTVRDADLILVLDRGRIVERGTHAQLMARAGRYAGMVGLQTGG